MRPLPAEVAALVRPMPTDFAVGFDDHRHYVRWSSSVMVQGHGPVQVELGYSKASGKADPAKEETNLRARVWQTMELARLGRIDLLQYCLTDRHKRNRVISRPQIKEVKTVDHEGPLQVERPDAGQRPAAKTNNEPPAGMSDMVEWSRE